MGTSIPTKPFDINKFWEKLPMTLKYFIIIALVLVGSYYLFSKTSTISQTTELTKIQESIEVTYNLIEQFQDFERTQYDYNAQTLTYLKNIYILVQELNENTNKKFAILLNSGGKSSAEILEKITLLNESFEKLQKAYSPKDDDLTFPEPKIQITKIKK